jgi:hypothetical protein
LAGSARAARRGRLGHHGVAGAAKNPLSHRINEDRARDHHGDERIRERVAANILQSREDLHAGDLRIVKDERRAELGEHPDENDRRAREQPRLDEGKGDLPEAAQPRAAEVLSRLLHGGVDVGEGRDGVQVNDGVEGERLHDRDAPKPVGGKPVEGPALRPESQVDDERVDGPVLPEDLLDPDRADKGGQDHRNEHGGIEDPLEGIKKPVRNVRQGHGDHQRKRRARAGQEKRVAEPDDVGRIAEQGAEEGKGDPPIGVDESAPDDLQNRPEEEDREKGGRDDEHHPGRGPRHGADSLGQLNGQILKNERKNMAATA